MRRLATAAGYLIRHLATGRPLPPEAANVMELWRGFIEDRCDGTLENLDTVLRIRLPSHASPGR
jgi:cobaltochelatase CobT